MHDHNLDDLIIDTIAPKNNKTKSFLTIVALLIVVLIVAIILTKTLLKSPENNTLVFEENLSEVLIAPELRLQETKPEPTEIAKPQDNSSLLAIIEDEISTPAQPTIDEVSKPSVEIIEETITPQIIKKPEVEKVTSLPPVEKKPIATNPAIKKPIVKKQITKKSTPKPQTKSTSSVKYYVQVGSFKENPSPRFLSVIKSSGFKYLVSKPDNIGNKKLLIGPYYSRKEVDKAREIVRDRIHKSAFVVQK